MWAAREQNKYSTWHSCLLIEIGHQSWAFCFGCAFIFLVPNHHLRGVWENDGFEDYEWPFAI